MFAAIVCNVRSFADGLTVSEYRPIDARAVAEIEALINEVFDADN